MSRPVTPSSAMAQRAALVTGISGQDGYYLACHLLDLGYIVHGLVRGFINRRPRLKALREAHKDRVILHYGDILDLANLISLLGTIKVDEIYHLAAQTHVARSFEQPLYTYNVNALGTTRVLEAITILKLTNVRFYNACSSEIFGQAVQVPQTEETLFRPVSPYGASKLMAYWATKIQREQHRMYAVSGILFNHESPLRDGTFVTRKVTLGVARIAKGLSDDIRLGHLDSKRDWTHAKDMVRGIHLMMTQETPPRDLVLASGQSRSVRTFVEVAFAVIGVKIKWRGSGIGETGYDTSNGKVRVRVDPRLFRPVEIHALLGDASCAAKVLGWRPTISFEVMVKEMVQEDLRALESSNGIHLRL